MTEPQEPRRIVVVGPDGTPAAVPILTSGDRPGSGPGGRSGHGGRGPDDAGDREGPGDADDAMEAAADAVGEPAKVMRIGTMIKQLLEEVRAAPLDEASRMRLREIHQRSIQELESGLAPELREELERITLPFTDDEVPSDAELRIAQAQLVGWLEGVFHGLQAALVAQQMAARMQLEQMRRGGALPPGASPMPGHEPGTSGTGQYL